MQKFKDLDVDFKKRTLLLGSTGSGKTRLMQDIAKRLEKECAIIFIDTKGDDTEQFIKQNENVKVIDKNASYNILKLDGNGSRQRQVHIASGRVLGMLGSLVDATTETKVFSLIAKLLDQLYENNDAPTLKDLHALLTKDKISEETGNSKLLDLLAIISGEKDFAGMFYGDGSVNLEELLTAGTSTVVKLPEHSSIDLTRFGLQTIIHGIWSAANVKKEKGDDTPVVILFDEFTKIRNLDIITDIVRQGRTMGVGIVLSSQLGPFIGLGDKTIEELLADCDNKIIGAVHDDDGQELARLMGAIGLDSTFSSNEYREWTLLSHKVHVDGDTELLINFTSNE